MTPAARIQASLDLLEAVYDVARPADAVISGFYRSRRFIGSHDRSALSTRIYSILRHHRRLNWWLGAQDLTPSARLRLLGWLSLGERLTYKQIDELCSGGKYALKALEPSEVQFLQKISGHTINHPTMSEEIKAECPEAYCASLKKRFGKNFKLEMSAMLDPAPLDLRVNSLKASRDDILKILKQQGIASEACPLSPWGVRIFERLSLNTLPILRNGSVEIQDEGSQMIAFVVGAKPGERVVDFCAGAGGKTLAIGATMQNKGRIIACDTIAGRLKPSAERFRRAGLHNIEPKVLTSERDPWVKKHKASFDKVLTDVPCSGIGTWRRNPDARWKNLGPSVETLIKLQAEILDSASRLVKAGGRLIYSTCSLLPDENEDQITRFLASHEDFAVEPCGLNGASFLALTPYQHNTDGFFAAVMVKKASTSEDSLLNEKD